MSTTGALWAAVVGCAIFAATVGLALVSQPLALVPSVLLLFASVYLIGGELWNKRRSK
jgi:hypothetical protein